MLKFAVDKPDAKLVFFGLSHENLDRLQAGQAIQFRAAEVGLGEGIVVIADRNDPALPDYKQADCELVVLDDNDYIALDTDLLERPLTLRSEGKPCRSFMFAGTNESAMLAALAGNGLLAPGAQIKTGAPSVYRVSAMNMLKHAGGALVFFALMALCLVDAKVEAAALMGVTGAVLGAFALFRLTQRVEVDGLGLRIISAFGTDSVPWGTVEQVLASSDSIGPYEVKLIVRNGYPRRLHRIYGDWDRLIDAIAASTRS